MLYPAELRALSGDENNLPRPVILYPQAFYIARKSDFLYAAFMAGRN
jgi:hypothetical protein